MNICERCNKPISDLETYGRHDQSYCLPCYVEQIAEDRKNLVDLPKTLDSLENEFAYNASEIDRLGASNNELNDQCREIEDRLHAIRERGLIPLEQAA